MIRSISKNESKENVRTGYHNKIIKHPRVGLAIPEIELMLNFFQQLVKGY